MIRKLRQLIQEEFGILQWRWQFARLLMAPFPMYNGSRFRSVALRLAGFRIGRGVLIRGMPTIIGPQKWGPHLSIGRYSALNVQIFFDLAAPITIGENVGIGPGTFLITGAHQIGDSSRRSGQLTPKPIRLGDGVWLGARCTVLPGVTIGEGAIVAAGSVVIRDVPPNTLVAGVPAVIKKHLDEVERPLSQPVASKLEKIYES